MKKNNRRSRGTGRVIAVLAALLVGGDSVAADPGPSPRIVSAADLQADAALLRRAYETLHPGLYRYRTPAEIDAAFAALDAEFARDRTLDEAYLAIARFTTSVQCGHTYPNFFNQGDEVRRSVLERPRLPFEFRWIDRRMIVTRSFAESPALRPGTEVSAIGGVPAATILEALLPYSRADGGNDAKRVSNLEVQGLARYEAFDVFYPLVFPKAFDAPLRLSIRTVPGGPVTDIAVPPMEAAARPVREGTPRGETNPWEFRRLAPDVAYLRMPTWAMYNSRWDWQAWLDDLFAGLVHDQAPNLVIDLRGNEGGSNVGDRILAHLVASEVSPRSVLRKTRYRRVPDDLRPYLETWDKDFYDWGEAAVPLDGRFYRLQRDGDDAGTSIVRPVPSRYSGRVWVLVGAANSSATFEFASAVRQLGLATLVGQATGGNQRGITGGAFFFLRLPESGIEVDLPLIGQFPIAERLPPDAGLEPDIHVPPRVEDVAAGRDAELETTLALIRAGTR